MGCPGLDPSCWGGGVSPHCCVEWDEDYWRTAHKTSRGGRETRDIEWWMTLAHEHDEICSKMRWDDKSAFTFTTYIAYCTKLLVNSFGHCALASLHIQKLLL
jgi:hypothetical protein